MSTQFYDQRLHRVGYDIDVTTDDTRDEIIVFYMRTPHGIAYLGKLAGDATEQDIATQYTDCVRHLATVVGGFGWPESEFYTESGQQRAERPQVRTAVPAQRQYKPRKFFSPFMH